MKKKWKSDELLARRRNIIISEAKKCVKNVKGSVWIPYSQKKYKFIKDNLQELNEIAERQNLPFGIIKFEDETRYIKYGYVSAKEH